MRVTDLNVSDVVVTLLYAETEEHNTQIEVRQYLGKGGYQGCDNKTYTTMGQMFGKKWFCLDTKIVKIFLALV